ncbi:MAG: hypothetical protein V1918_00440 [Planctomycetota bacterium]
MRESTLPLSDMRQGLKGFYRKAAVGNVLFFSALFALVPAARAQLTEEGKFMEYFSAVLWFSAGFLGILAIALRGRGGVPRLAYLIPLLGLGGFLDETSFVGLLAGQDNLSSSGAAGAAEASPVMLWGYPVDGVHDLVAVFFKLWRDHLGRIGDLVGFSILGGLIVLAFLKRRRYMPRLMAAARAYPPFDYLRYAAILMIVAQVLDLDVFPGIWSMFYEELLETNAGFAMACGGAAMLLGPMAEGPPAQEKG